MAKNSMMSLNFMANEKGLSSMCKDSPFWFISKTFSVCRLRHCVRCCCCDCRLHCCGHRYYGFHRCSCCRCCGCWNLNCFSMKSCCGCSFRLSCFLMMSCCGCSFRLNCFSMNCCGCRFHWNCGSERTVGVHIRNWSVTDGYRTERCSSCALKWCCFPDGWPMKDGLR